MSTSHSPPAPVDGVVIRRSTIKTIGFILLNILFVPMGVFLIWAKLDPAPNATSEVTWYGFVAGICLVLGGPVMVVLLLRSLWVRRRLVIGCDRLQIIERLGGKETVILQIPYDNIADLKYEATTTERRVGITLLRPDHPHSYAKSENFGLNMQFHGRHYCITGGYRSSLWTMVKEIERAYGEWSRS